MNPENIMFSCRYSLGDCARHLLIKANGIPLIFSVINVSPHVC